MKIRIKSGDCPSYLTVGKVYDVVWTRYGDMYDHLLTCTAWITV